MNQGAFITTMQQSL